MFLTFSLLSGLFWTITYILIIRRCFLDQTYGMPLVALGANISWEFIFAFVHPHRMIQRSVNIVWFLCDAIIVFQLLRYGRREFPDLSKLAFYLLTVITLAMSFCMVLFISYEFLDLSGAYAAFGQNLLMSVLFVSMLYQRKSLRGQSVWIALAKLLGTLFASLAFFFYVVSFQDSVLMPFLYGTILVFDAVYVLMILAYQRDEQEPISSS